jgi:hypothetical protein
MSAEVSPNPLSRQAAHQGVAKTSALTTPPISVRPLPLRASRWPYARPPPARRRPPSHPAGTSRQNAAPRLVDGHHIDKLCAGVAQGVQNRSILTTPESPRFCPGERIHQATPVRHEDSPDQPTRSAGNWRIFKLCFPSTSPLIISAHRSWRYDAPQRGRRRRPFARL